MANRTAPLAAISSAVVLAAAVAAITATAAPAQAAGLSPFDVPGRGATVPFVEFTLTKPANAVTVRYSVPDGRDASLDLRTGSTLIKTVPVTSRSPRRPSGTCD